MASPVFKTGATRLRRVGWVRFPHAPATFLARHLARHLARSAAVAAAAIGIATASLGAQQRDTAQAAAGAARARRTPATPDTAARPPISPRRAFLSSLLVPGYGQARLDRATAGALFAAVEVASIAMARKSADDLRYAKAHAADSAYDYVDNNGEQQRVLRANRYAGGRVAARKTHYEDWIAVLVFNHLFSGADAFVAAQLWDVPAHVSVRPDGRGAVVAASVAW